MLVRAELWDLALSLYFQLALFLAFLADGLQFFRHLESIFLVLEDGYELAFTFALTIFSTTFFHKSK